MSIALKRVLTKYVPCALLKNIRRTIYNRASLKKNISKHSDKIMAKEKTEVSAAFLRTRADHAIEILEDYAEAIAQITKENGKCRVMDLARYFGVSHVSVIQVLQRLKANHFIENGTHKPICLTEEGRKLARECANRHGIVLQFLLKIGVSENTAMLDSEGLEHHISAETLECMKNFIAVQ